MMRVSKSVAENNGLACESTWIPVEQGKKYRFTPSTTPPAPPPASSSRGLPRSPTSSATPRTPNPPAASSTAPNPPRKKNAGWDLIEMDFTPPPSKTTDPKIQWLRVDLYIYLAPGDVFFDDITVKKIDE